VIAEVLPFRRGFFAGNNFSLAFLDRVTSFKTAYILYILGQNKSAGADLILPIRMSD